MGVMTARTDGPSRLFVSNSNRPEMDSKVSRNRPEMDTQVSCDVGDAVLQVSCGTGDTRRFVVCENCHLHIST